MFCASLSYDAFFLSRPNTLLEEIFWLKYFQLYYLSFHAMADFDAAVLTSEQQLQQQLQQMHIQNQQLRGQIHQLQNQIPQNVPPPPRANLNLPWEPSYSSHPLGL